MTITARLREVSGFDLHPAQKAIYENTARFRVVACGRRFGKTEVAKWILLEQALQGKACWWLSPTYAMSDQVWRDLCHLSEQLDPEVQIEKSNLRITFSNGGWIAFRSAHAPNHLRGAGLDFVVLDEAAFMKPSIWYQVVQPMLLERRGGALFLSTPYGFNWFWRVYTHGVDDAHPEWQAFHYRSDDNPKIRTEDLEQIRLTTTERVFRVEYLAEFVQDEGVVFRHIDDAVTDLPAQPEPHHRYVAGIDWGRQDDYTAICIMDAETHHVVAVERFRHLDWIIQRERISTLFKTWGVQTAFAESNSMGSVNIELLQRAGLPIRPFSMTAVSKAPLIDALAVAFEHQQIRIPRHETLIHELVGYIQVKLPGGGYRFTATEGLHDDYVIALALAYHALKYGGGSISFV